MIIGAADKALIYAGPALDACLVTLMVIKQRWRSFPALTLFVLTDLLSGSVLYWIDPNGISALYTRIYLAYDVFSFLLQFAILYEVAKNVLKPTGIWTRGAFKPFFLLGAFGGLLAFASTLLLQPVGIRGAASVQLRIEIFFCLLTCELVIAMMLSAKQVGLPWRSHTMAVGQGLMFWALIFATLQGLAAYLGPHNLYYGTLYYLRSANYLVVLTYWTVSLWRDEPARRPISPALRKYVIALNERVQYDLGKVGH